MGEREENGTKEKDVTELTISNGEPINGKEDKPKKEVELKNGKNNAGEIIVDKNTQKILKSLSNGNGNKKPKK